MDSLGVCLKGCMFEFHRISIHLVLACMQSLPVIADLAHMTERGSRMAISSTATQSPEDLREELDRSLKAAVQRAQRNFRIAVPFFYRDKSAPGACGPRAFSVY